MPGTAPGTTLGAQGPNPAACVSSPPPPPPISGDPHLPLASSSPIPGGPTPPLPQVTLEKVLGITTQTSSSLACDPTTGLLAYPAG